MEDFYRNNSRDGGFLQSPAWADFQRFSGREVFLFGDELDFRALFVKQGYPLGISYWLCPRGPIFCQETMDDRSTEDFIDLILKVARKEKVGWIRIEPQSAIDQKRMTDYAGRKNMALVKAKKNHQPAQTLMVDLTRTQQEILTGFKPKTRYNVRLAEKKGVKVAQAKTQEERNFFCDLLEETARRDRITNHPREHYLKMLQTIDGGKLKLFLARSEEKILAGALVSFFGGVATYLHGGSSDEKRNLMAPFLLHWEVMKWAKEQGMERYDLRGIRLARCSAGEIESEGAGWVPAEGHWQGISRFKQGFCAQCEPVEFPGAWDLVLDHRQYRLYRVVQFFSDLIRRKRQAG